MPLLVRDGTLLTMDAHRSVVRADLLARDGRIEDIGPSLTAPPGCEVLEAEGRLVLPGLVQAHVHLCQTLFRHQAEGRELLPWLRERILPFEAAHDASSVRASAELGIAELLLGGTTAVQDMGTVRHTEEIFDAAARLGLRLVGGKAMMDVPERAPGALLESARSSVDEAVALARRYHRACDGRLGYAFAPRFALSCSRDLLEETARQARALGARLHTHASENRDECAAVRALAGCDNIDYLARLGLAGSDVSLAHCVHLSEAELGRLAEAGTHVVHCPSANLKLASGVAPVPELLLRGVNVALGADGAACNNGLDAFLEMRLAALLHRPRAGAASMPALRALELATVGGARALGLEAEIGSLEVGKRADLLVLDLRGARHAPAPADDLYAAVVFGAGPRDVTAVAVDGRVLVRDGRLVDADEDAIAARAGEQLARLRSRAGI